MQFMAQIQGGVGPDVWDREVFIDGDDFLDAAHLASAKAEELGGQVTQLDQCDCSEAEALERTLPRARRIIESAIQEHCEGADLWLCADLAARKVLTHNDTAKGPARSDGPA